MIQYQPMYEEMNAISGLNTKKTTTPKIQLTANAYAINPNSAIITKAPASLVIKSITTPHIFLKLKLSFILIILQKLSEKCK